MNADAKKPELSDLDQAALYFHKYPVPGKLEIQATKPLGNQRDLALAYSPGVAAPCLAIRDDPATAADYTARANLVARHLQRHGRARPRQYRPARLQAGHGRQGRSVQEIRRHRRVRHRDRRARTSTAWSKRSAALEPTFGGINLEDIKAPECFEVEERLQGAMKHPGLPRRPARHRDHRRGRGAQRAGTRRQGDRRRQDRHLRRGCCSARLPQSAGYARRQAREHLGHRSRRPRL